jgi:hypothetical protein
LSNNNKIIPSNTRPRDNVKANILKIIIESSLKTFKYNKHIDIM